MLSQGIGGVPETWDGVVVGASQGRCSFVVVKQDTNQTMELLERWFVLEND